eukprot:scaffold45126_cov26-Prasinocladus_malaysianus.AAC.1
MYRGIVDGSVLCSGIRRARCSIVDDAGLMVGPQFNLIHVAATGHEGFTSRVPRNDSPDHREEKNYVPWQIVYEMRIGR